MGYFSELCIEFEQKWLNTYSKAEFFRSVPKKKLKLAKQWVASYEHVTAPQPKEFTLL